MTLKNNLLFTVLLLSIKGYAQVGIGTVTPDSNSVLELKSTSKGVLPPRLTIAQRNSILNPQEGLYIYNTDMNCLEWWTGFSWMNACDGKKIYQNSGGTAQIINYDCNTLSDSGVLIAGVPIQTNSVLKGILVSGITDGSFNIIAQNNGITFARSGYITSAANGFYLYASGTPINPGWTSFALNVGPGCFFSVYVNQPSSGGTSILNSITCSSTGSGNLYTNIPPSGVSHNLVVDVQTLGSYNFNTTNAGITFSASGNFTSLGLQTVSLVASGLSTDSGNHIFSLNTNPSCSFSRFIGTTYQVGDSTQGGKIVYVDNTGLHGLVAAPVSYSSINQYCNFTLMSIGANSTTDGQFNTNQINIFCPGHAASYCENLVIGSYNDWFLPTTSEFQHIINSGYLNQFANNSFWTSLEMSSSSARSYNKSSNSYQTIIKSNAIGVIPVRDF